MNIHMSRRLFLVAAVLGGVAVFAAVFFVALAVHSVVAGPSASPDPPNPGHIWEQIELPLGTWPGLDADTVDGLHAHELGGAGYWTQAGSDLYANNTSWNVGVGVTGPDSKLHVWSDTLDGVHGVTQASDRAGVWGYSGDGVGVRGTSGNNDGVVGGTGASDKAGVFGNGGTSGLGVAGLSGGNHGVKGVTSSANSMHAGVYGENNGAGPAIRSQGDLYVTGAYYGNLPNGGAPYPRPAYNSLWIDLQAGSNLLNHNIGGDPDKYVVELEFNETNQLVDPYIGITNKGVGQNRYWYDLTANTITVYSANACTLWCDGRVRIWVIN